MRGFFAGWNASRVKVPLTATMGASWGAVHASSRSGLHSQTAGFAESVGPGGAGASCAPERPPHPSPSVKAALATIDFDMKLSLNQRLLPPKYIAEKHGVSLWAGIFEALYRGKLPISSNAFI